MLFNDPIFILIFLPITVAGFFLLGRMDRRFATAWLVAASLFFYGYWKAEYVLILVFSILFNFTIGGYLATRPSRWGLALGVAGNLALLGFYKYTGFLMGMGNDLFDMRWTVPSILLPLAISFFTFQQVAFLCDCNDGQTRERNLLNYFLFVCFFPQLIAGPIVHHSEMLPQFRRSSIFRPMIRNFAIGTTIFGIGLTKKVVIADSISVWADPVFNAAAAGQTLNFIEGWVGSVAFTLQLYFDFSGYSDMAIGIARLFGIRLPLNFNSPLKSHNIIEFWTRWHMTLSRFLAAYLYNPMVLSVTRKRMAEGKPVLRQSKAKPGVFIRMLALPTMITFFLAGIWHGAGIQFI
ncbi:MAG: MBOAT family protein, partial [Gammaproteobacteria bacterium]|nr:MBOAT family protein [Gammaproteobacteria bacterium]